MEYVGKRMIVDTDDYDGNIHFNMETFDFYPHHTKEPKFSWRYDQIKKITQSRPFIKACVTIVFKDNHVLNLYNYRPATLIALLKSGIDASKEVVEVDLTKEDKKEDVVDQLEKLNKLYKEGVITEEEFNNIKARLTK